MKSICRCTHSSVVNNVAQELERVVGGYDNFVIFVCRSKMAIPQLGIYTFMPSIRQKNELGCNILNSYFVTENWYI
jgi:hypothetical protein